ncbi:MAG TPA: anthranilate phosphoribosyltransferase [Candidatus Desulfofervidus auxilii]|uniref:Anthranilate phosphoribosyltransferase n=1 Tax=Desulfofervidus auxilii TaxID=1621989 RepID=A0A7C0Y2B7_DESA2|nr:anthranilate phosphoribosyltransferase [Candidatus Desulfofervidus auxilii]
MLKGILGKLVEGKDLDEDEMTYFMSAIMEGKATPAQIGAFLVALRMKGETITEITSAAKVIRDKAYKIEVKRDKPLVDTCGTGGDGKNTFNVSTVTAFVVAGAGLKVAKHGNRSVSSHCGSADVIEALGINLELDIEKVARCIDEIGIGFLFAPKFHPAMKYALSPRRELGLRTIFNILGPLTNPAKTTHQVIGVYDKKWLFPLAHVSKNLGLKGAMIVHGEGGYDEITITGKTYVAELKEGEIFEYEINPKSFGLNIASEEEIKGKDREYNAQLLKDILLDKEKGAKYDMVLLNAAAVFKITNLVKNWEDGIDLAKEVIKSKKAYEKLEKLIKMAK